MPDFAGIDLNLLVAFDVLMQERNVTRAAGRLGLTQSAMSHTLSRLRVLFADPILARRGSEMVKTALAEQLEGPIRQALSDLGGLVRSRVAFDPATAKRVFRVASSDYGQLVVLPKLVARIAAEAPFVDLVVKTPSHPERVLGDGTFDVAIAPARPETPSGIQRTRLFADRLVVLMRREHPAAHGALDLERYLSLRHALIAPRGGRGGMVDDVLADLGRERRIVLTVPSFLVAPRVLLDADVVLTAPERLARSVADLPLVIRDLPLDVPAFGFFLLWHERSHHDPAHVWLRARIADVCR